MPGTSSRRSKQASIEAQFAMAERVLRGLHKSIDDQIDRARDLEVEHALALHKAGKATVHDSSEVMAKARKLIG